MPTIFIWSRAVEYFVGCLLFSYGEDVLIQTRSTQSCKLFSREEEMIKLDSLADGGSKSDIENSLRRTKSIIQLGGFNTYYKSISTYLDTHSSNTFLKLFENQHSARLFKSSKMFEQKLQTIKTKHGDTSFLDSIPKNDISIFRNNRFGRPD